MSIVIAILIFCIIIIIHEIGHFSAAKMFNIKVTDFSLGMGPTILRKRGKETNYNIKAIPFGGSVQLDEEVDDDDPRAFRNKPVWQKMIVMLAGAFMNIVLGFILCAIMVVMSEAIATSTVAAFREEAVSNQYLQPGDKITHVNGMKVFTYFDMTYQFVNTQLKLSEDANKAFFDITVIRNGEKFTLKDVAFNVRDNDEGGKSVYFDFKVLAAKKNLLSVISEAGKQVATYSRLIIITLFDMIRGTYGLNDIAGPVGVVVIIDEASSEGFKISFADGIWNSLFIAALMTVNVGIFNLLPIPALDGSKFIFYCFEAIRRKPVKAEVEGMIHFVGFMALMAFMLLITVLDIRKLFQ